MLTNINKMTNTILCIDDDPMFGMVAESLLKRLDDRLDIVCITSGDVAIKFLDQSSSSEMPKVILMDINLTKFNAFDLIDVFKNHGINDIPIFLVTSSIFSEDKKRASEEPLIKGILKKPFRLDSAEKVVESLSFV